MAHKRLSRLSSQELSVMVLLGFGLTDEEIAETADLESDQLNKVLRDIGRFVSLRLDNSAERAPVDLDTVPEIDLSPRQLEVARLAARGYTNPQIASRLGIGVRSVETHMGNVLRRLRLKGRRELMTGRRL